MRFVAPAIVLEKGLALGGKYYRRVPTGDSAKPWKYYYTQEAYEAEHGASAHVHGGEALARRRVTPAALRALLKDSLGIPRIEMPQITSAAFADFIAHLNSEGVASNAGRDAVQDLRATQATLDLKKVRRLVASEREALEKPIIVSRDGYVLDGHHRWAALRLLDGNAEIQTTRVNLPMTKLLEHARAFGGAEYRKALRPELRSFAKSRFVATPPASRAIRLEW